MDESIERAPGLPRREAVLAVALLGLGTFALHAKALTAFFVGDDFDFLVGTRSLDGLGDTLRFSFWGEWEPVWWASWALDHDLWGAWPPGFHATNVFWAAVCAFGVFACVRAAWPEARFLAWGAALLFATHPIHDEAVTYLAARGHPMATGLALLALAAWLRAASGKRRAAWLVASCGLGLLAALAKETVLVLPVWAAAIEAARSRRWRPALAAGAWLAVPMVASLVLRGAIVGFGSDKLTGGLEDPAGLAGALFDQLPRYALMGWAPFPAAFAGEAALDSAAPLGWLLLALLGGIAGVGGLRAQREPSMPAVACEAFAVGLVVFTVSLGPVVWADLGLRRRYLFTPSVGIALAAAALLYVLYRRAPRAAWAALLALAIAGGAGTWQRNALYVESGEVARRTLETLRGAPLDRPAATEGPEHFALLTLPRAWGGDNLSGAYLFHHTDLRSGLAYYDAPTDRLHYALKCYYADDYRAEARFEDRHTLELRVQFGGGSAFRDAFERDATDDAFGELLYAERTAASEDERFIAYRVHLRPGFWEHAALYLYSDGALYPLVPPDRPALDLSDF